MTKRLNFVINGKGGVGKSFFATNFVQHLKDRQIPHAAVDTDQENSTLKRFHPDSGFIDPEQPQELDTIFALIEKHDLVIVDCRAASTDLFLRYFTEIAVFEVLEAAGAELTVIMPVNHENDSIEQVRLVSTSLESRCSYVLVRNEVHSEQFRIYDNSRSRQRILHEFSGREISMKRMQDWLVASLNEYSLTATNAITHPAFTLIDRQRLKHWQRHFDAQVDLAADLLLPDHANMQTVLPLEQ
ncbi:MAG: mobilization protein [Chthoniobacteraceae bacterium]|nr:mobilization protein [Chthoniobacteraceae bacterium]